MFLLCMALGPSSVGDGAMVPPFDNMFNEFSHVSIFTYIPWFVVAESLV